MLTKWFRPQHRHAAGRKPPNQSASAGPAVAQQSVVDAAHWRAERQYWAGKLRDWLADQYGLPMHQLQEDDATVPASTLVSQIQNPQKCSPDNYFATGSRTVLTYLRELHHHGFAPNRFEKILEFGVGLGRLMRHFVSFPCQRFGCDITADALNFTRGVLGQHVQLSENSIAPPLPYADSSFDFVYANSVFTHIQMQATPGWIAELRRVLRPGGALIATVFEPNRYLGHSSPRELDEVEQGPGYLEWGASDVNERFMYMTPSKLLEVWSQHFKVLELCHHFREQSHLILSAS